MMKMLPRRRRPRSVARKLTMMRMRDKRHQRSVDESPRGPKMKRTTRTTPLLHLLPKPNPRLSASLLVTRLLLPLRSTAPQTMPTTLQRKSPRKDAANPKPPRSPTMMTTTKSPPQQRRLALQRRKLPLSQSSTMRRTTSQRRKPPRSEAVVVLPRRVESVIQHSSASLQHFTFPDLVWKDRQHSMCEARA